MSLGADFRVHNLTSLGILFAFEDVVSRLPAPIPMPPHRMESHTSRPCVLFNYLPQHTKSKIKWWAGAMCQPLMTLVALTAYHLHLQLQSIWHPILNPTGSRFAHGTYTYVPEDTYILLNKLVKKKQQIKKNWQKVKHYSFDKTVFVLNSCWGNNFGFLSTGRYK